MSTFIRQLTGVRFVAAAWVLGYHLQGPLAVLGIASVPVLSDTLRVGRLGVDLFFALSGFILTHTYLTRLGQRLRAQPTAGFWWLRLARVYPVHLVMLIVAGLAVIAQARVTGGTLDRDWLNPIDFGRNLLLVQEWGPSPQRGWNFVAWSLSMEWLAYLCFPLVILVIWRMHKRLPTGFLLIAWVVILLPLMALAMRTTDPYYTDAWGSTIRLATEFIAGAVTYLIVRRVTVDGEPSPRAERVASALAIALPVAVVIGATILGRLPVAQPPSSGIGPEPEPLPPYFHLVLVPLLVAWIGALAVARHGMARGLATRTLVLGGFVSYSLYMTHLVWFGLWRAAMSAIGITGGAVYAIGVVGLVLGALLIAWLMWRFVEEPAREWMRRLVGARAIPTEEAGERIAERDGDQATPVIVPGSEGIVDESVDHPTRSDGPDDAPHDDEGRRS